MFAIDGVKLLSNASKEWSGTKEDLLKKKEKLEAALKYMITQHRNRDKEDKDTNTNELRFKERLNRARQKIEKLGRWLQLRIPFYSAPKSGPNRHLIRSEATSFVL